MSGVEELRGGIAAANEHGREAIASIQQAVTLLEEAQGSLAAATQGTARDEVMAASAGLAEAIQTLGAARGTVNASIETAESYAAGL